MTLSTSVRAGVNAKQGNVLDLGESDANIAKSFALTLANGTAAGQADRCFSDTRTIVASGTDDLDLAGTLTDAFGATVTFAKVKVIMVVAAAGNTNNVVIGGAAANQFATWAGAGTHTVTVRPGGTFLLSVGSADLNAYAVTAGTGDVLRIANSGGTTSVAYDIVVVGTSV